MGCIFELRSLSLRKIDESHHPVRNFYFYFYSGIMILFPNQDQTHCSLTVEEQSCALDC